jgi:pentatricopeptide repeat protein
MSSKQRLLHGAASQMPHLIHSEYCTNLMRAFSVLKRTPSSVCFQRNPQQTIAWFSTHNNGGTSAGNQNQSAERSLNPTMQKLQDRTLHLIKIPVGQWTSHEISTANTLIDQWLSLEEQSRQSANRAVQVFRRWLLELEEGNPLVRNFDFVEILHRVLYACLSVDNDQNYKNCKRLVETLERVSNELEQESLLPGDKAYSMLLQILAQTHGKEPETTIRAEKLLEHRLSKAGGQGCDLILWNAVLLVLAENSPYNTEAAAKAEKIMKSMSVEPDMISFSTVLNSLARSKSPNATHRAHNLLELMLDSESIEVNNWSFNVVINALSTVGSPEAAKAAEDLLWKLVQLTKAGKKGFEPDTYTFSSVINCWAKSGAREGPERAERIMRRIPELASEFGWSVKLDQHSYHTTIDAWASSSLPDAVRRAEGLLREMELAYTDGNVSLRPNEYAYTTVIKALSRSREFGAGERAEKVLFKMEDLSRSGAGGIKLNSICYAATIHAWAKSREPDAPDRALAILRRMQKLREEGNDNIIPSTSAYNAAISAFANRGDAETALSLLSEMIEQTKKGLANASPSLHTYSSVLNALAKSRAPSSAAKAMTILDTLEARCAAGDTESCPNQVVYTVAINCLGNSPDTHVAKQAEALFWKMQRLHEQGHNRCKPNVHTLWAVLNAFMLSASSAIQMEDVAARAIAILDWAEQEAQRGDRDLRPNRACYNALIGVWAKSGQHNSLTEIMTIVKKMASDTDAQMKPDFVTYNWMMTTIVDAKLPDAAIQCHRILRNMLRIFDNGNGNQDVKPTRRSFHCVLEACLLPNQSDDAKLLVLQDMAGQITTCRFWRPSSNTYVLFFRGLASVGDQPDMIVARKVMQHAISLKLVDGINGVVQEAFGQVESRSLSWSSPKH